VNVGDNYNRPKVSGLKQFKLGRTGTITDCECKQKQNILFKKCYLSFGDERIVHTRHEEAIRRALFTAMYTEEDMVQR
jgi:hypothetical protein